jgi:hypothetical protein
MRHSTRLLQQIAGQLQPLTAGRDASAALATCSSLLKAAASAVDAQEPPPNQLGSWQQADTCRADASKSYWRDGEACADVTPGAYLQGVQAYQWPPHQAQRLLLPPAWRSADHSAHAHQHTLPFSTLPDNPDGLSQQQQQQQQSSIGASQKQAWDALNDDSLYEAWDKHSHHRR